MPLSAYARKYMLPHGAMTEIATKTGYSISLVSEVVGGKKRNRRIEIAVARKLKMRVDEVFAPEDEIRLVPPDEPVVGAA